MLGSLRQFEKQGFSRSILILVSVSPNIILLNLSLIIVDVDKPEALIEYYKLLLAVLRVITSVVLSRGPQNKQTLEQARHFIAEYRPSMVAIFKRQAKIGAAMDRNVSITVDELVELYVLLVSSTGFLDVSSTA